MLTLIKNEKRSPLQLIVKKTTDVGVHKLSEPFAWLDRNPNSRAVLSDNAMMINGQIFSTACRVAERLRNDEKDDQIERYFLKEVNHGNPYMPRV